MVSWRHWVKQGGWTFAYLTTTTPSIKQRLVLILLLYCCEWAWGSRLCCLCEDIACLQKRRHSFPLFCYFMIWQMPTVHSARWFVFCVCSVSASEKKKEKKGKIGAFLVLFSVQISHFRMILATLFKCLVISVCPVLVLHLWWCANTW